MRSCGGHLALGKGQRCCLKPGETWDRGHFVNSYWRGRQSAVDQHTVSLLRVLWYLFPEFQGGPQPGSRGDILNFELLRGEFLPHRQLGG